MSEAKSETSIYPNAFYRVSLKCVIKNDKGEILVVKEYDSTTWNLPGGGWDHGETETEALSRELFEEVGYKGGFTAIPVATAPFWLAHRQAWLLWVVYELAPDNFDFSVGEYCSEVAFIDIKSLKNSTAPAEKWIFENLN